MVEGIDSRIKIIENDFKKNYKLTLENLLLLENVLVKLENLFINISKVITFFFYDLVFVRFNKFDTKLLELLFISIFFDFLKYDFLTRLVLKKRYFLNFILRSLTKSSKKLLYKINLKTSLNLLK